MTPRNDASQCPEGKPQCATQTFYYLPKAWLRPGGGGGGNGTNTLTVFEAGGIDPAGGDLRHAGLALATMRVPGKDGGALHDLSSVVSCEF
mmetsp:Transcript_48671/g.112672  ORF Transcript_48671/g.112672 Transcript_48671/m.112672 type:complete len:91 (+) Transcript_48671:114-386(+)